MQTLNNKIKICLCTIIVAAFLGVNYVKMKDKVKPTESLEENQEQENSSIPDQTSQEEEETIEQPIESNPTTESYVPYEEEGNINQSQPDSQPTQPSQSQPVVQPQAPICTPKKFDFSWFRADFTTQQDCIDKGSKYSSYGYACTNATDDCGVTYYMLELYDDKGISHEYWTVEENHTESQIN